MKQLLFGFIGTKDRTLNRATKTKLFQEGKLNPGVREIS